MGFGLTERRGAAGGEGALTLTGREVRGAPTRPDGRSEPATPDAAASAAGRASPCGPPPASYGLGTEGDPLPLGQRLRRHGQPQIAIVLRLEQDDPGLQRGPMPSV